MYILFNNVYVLFYGCFASMYVYVSSVFFVSQRPEESVRSVELELQIVMNHSFDAGNPKQVLSKHRKRCNLGPSLQLRT